MTRTRTRPHKPPVEPNILGELIENARRGARLHREDLAYKAGVRSMTIARIELGHTTDPHWSTIVAIARVLDLDLEQLADQTVT